MVKAHSSCGPGKLTKQGKLLIANAMFEKGVNFAGAAFLLRQNGGYENVVLHLISQGLENILKSILLYENYDKYERKIQKKIGHNLVKAANAVIKAKNSRGISKELRSELENINHFYKNHLLRYGGISDIFIQHTKKESELTLHKLMQIIKIVRYRQMKCLHI